MTVRIEVKRRMRGWALAAVVLAVAGCEDASLLDVDNLNEPDRERALGEAGDLEALVGGTWSVYFNNVHGSGSNIHHGFIVNLYPAMATEMVATMPGGAVRENIQEPRSALDNSVDVGNTTGTHGPRRIWDDMHSIAASSRAGLRTIDALGLTVRDASGADVTPRVRAFAKFMQGMAWATLAMLIDQAVIVDETMPDLADPVQQAIANLQPWETALARGLAAIEDAVQIAQANNVTFPSASSSPLYFAGPSTITTDQFVQFANTMMARFLVLSPRIPQDRAAVDWSRVLTLTGQGLAGDFETQLAPGFRASTLYARLQNNPPGCATCLRWDPRLVGQADVSGAYQAWAGGTQDTRNRFDIVTPDRRITGPTPTSAGAYTVYRSDDNGFDAGAGLYLFSAYQWQRHAHRGFNANTGAALMASADENRLLRAEALLRTGDLPGAASLINVTRTRSHVLPGGVSYPGLPPVDVDGVPLGANCVPRTDGGLCGDLMVALRYERMIELAGLDAIRGWADSRGFGLLPDDTWLQAPVAPEELQLLGIPNYTFGGGGSYSAVYAPAGTGR